MGDFERIAAAAEANGKPVHETKGGYWVSSHQDGVYTDSPQLTVNRRPGTPGINIQYKYIAEGNGADITADYAIDMIQGRGLTPRSAADRIYTAAIASGYAVSPNGFNSMLVTHASEEARRDPANSYLVVMVKDDQVSGADVLHFTGSHENGNITVSRAIEMIEAGTL